MITSTTVAVHIAEGMLPVAGGEWMQTGGHTRLDYINQLPVITSITQAIHMADGVILVTGGHQSLDHVYINRPFMTIDLEEVIRLSHMLGPLHQATQKSLHQSKQIKILILPIIKGFGAK